MPWICIHHYVLGVVLVLYIVNANDELQNSYENTSHPITSAHTPSANQNSPTVTTLVQADYHGRNLTNNTTPGRDDNQTQDQTGDGDIGTISTVLPRATTSQSEEVNVTSSYDNIRTTPVVVTSGGEGSVTAGYVILLLILLVIVILVVVLYVLRKKSRRYSFDLQRAGYDHDTPLTCMEQPGTFETNEKAGGFEYVREYGDDDDQSMNPVVNSSSVEVGSAGENANQNSPKVTTPVQADYHDSNLTNNTTPGRDDNQTQDQTGDGDIGTISTVDTVLPTEGEKQGHGDGDGDSFNNFCGCEITLNPPVKRVGFSLDLDLSDWQPDQSDAGEQNGNNNNVAMGMTPDPPGLTFDPVGPGDFFTEINLDI